MRVEVRGREAGVGTRKERLNQGDSTAFLFSVPLRIHDHEREMLPPPSLSLSVPLLFSPAAVAVAVFLCRCCGCCVGDLCLCVSQ